jgi:hydrogenase nickel incorporation protein HypA/HybF
MHELGLMQHIVETCGAEARGAKVERITIEVGALSGVMPEALAFCFEVCIEGTPLAGSRLEIVRLPGRARCRGCGAGFELNDLLQGCGCGSYDLEVTAGEELRIKQMEVA